MNKEQRIQALDNCLEVLNDWNCELPQHGIIPGRIQVALDVLQSLRGFILSGETVQEETTAETITRLLNDRDVLDETTRVKVRDAVQLATQYIENKKNE